MGAFAEIGTYLLQTLFELYLFVVLLRFLLQVARADFYNPISQFLVKATNPLLMPLRRIVPGFGGLDIASLVLALLLQVIAMTLLLLLNGYGFYNPGKLALWGLIGTLSIVANIYFFGLLASIVLSWIAPNSYNPAAQLITQLVAPVMRPVQRFIPPMGGLDLSPIFVFLALNVVKIVIAHLSAATGLPAQLVLGV